MRGEISVAYLLVKMAPVVAIRPNSVCGLVYAVRAHLRLAASCATVRPRLQTRRHSFVQQPWSRNIRKVMQTAVKLHK